MVDALFSSARSRLTSWISPWCATLVWSTHGLILAFFHVGRQIGTSRCHSKSGPTSYRSPRNGSASRIDPPEWNGTTAPMKWMCLRLLGVETRHGLTLHAAVTQCNCTSLMITVTTSFSVVIIKIITDSNYIYILQQPSVTASSVMINFRAWRTKFGSACTGVDLTSTMHGHLVAECRIFYSWIVSAMADRIRWGRTVFASIIDPWRTASSGGTVSAVIPAQYISMRVLEMTVVVPNGSHYRDSQYMFHNMHS